MKAKNREQFEAIWKEHIGYLSYLTSSLPLGEPALEVLRIKKRLLEILQVAIEHTYET